MQFFFKKKKIATNFIDSNSKITIIERKELSWAELEGPRFLLHSNKSLEHNGLDHEQHSYLQSSD